jgi:hypothetical protein
MEVMVDDLAGPKNESSRGTDRAPAVVRWTTNVESLGINVFKVFAKNFVLLAGLVQLICRLVVKPSDVVDRNIGIWGDGYRLLIFLEVSEFGRMDLGCRSSGGFWCGGDGCRLCVV